MLLPAKVLFFGLLEIPDALSAYGQGVAGAVIGPGYFGHQRRSQNHHHRSSRSMALSGYSRIHPVNDSTNTLLASSTLAG